MRWSPQQDDALLRVSRWLEDRDRPFFYLGGWAGTGKTTLARELASSHSALFAAYTGKAASVMRGAGCVGARTIHSLIYQPQDKSRKHLRELEARKTALTKQRDMRLDDSSLDVLDQEWLGVDDEIRAEKENLKRPSFTLNLESDLRGADLLVVDEASMVDQQMGEDLLSFGVPVLVLGDPAQLPPIYGAGFFTCGQPDLMLTEVHRQALDSPVLWLATEVREGRTLALGRYGESAVVSSVAPEEVLSAGQLLVGRNATRRNSNARLRELRGYAQRSPFPLEGERLVCLRNNHELGLMNGGLYVAQQDASVGDGWVNLRLVPAEGGQPILVSAHREHFLGRGDEIDHWDRRDAEEFDYGGAMTVHKFQGSQEKSIVLIDEWFQDHRREWLYTGLTRAQEKIRVVRK